MDLVILIGSFFVMLFLGIPIAFTLCLSSILYLVLYTNIPLIIVAQQLLKGVDSFTTACDSVLRYCRLPDAGRRYFAPYRRLRKKAGRLDSWRHGSR